jgi:hypothetical protein
VLEGSEDVHLFSTVEEFYTLFLCCKLARSVLMCDCIDLSEEQELEGWVARPITHNAARGCHFHDALDTLLRQALDQHTWSIEYRCVVFQHSRRVYPNCWEATCLVRHPENSLRGAEICSEHYSISKRVC